jgi:prepilin-type N-terminal cleavage/methylation domain-containing protein/prepilin-type processing-associated H-X9-DG protein
MPRNARAFTLIELLVVISIIGVLVAVLLPAIGKASDLAKVTKCMANQKSIVMLGMGIYTGDYKGYLVPTAGDTGAARPMPGNGNVYSVVDLSSNAMNMANYNIEMWELMDPSANLIATPSAKKAAYAYCPASPRPWFGHSYSYPYYEANYAQNLWLSRYGGPANPTLLMTRAEKVNKPGDKVFFVETHQLGLHGVRSTFAQAYPGLYIMVPLMPQFMQIAGYTSPTSPQRHQEGFTTSYTDGHVAYVKHPMVFSAFWLLGGGVTSTEWFNPWGSGIDYRPLWDPTY